MKVIGLCGGSGSGKGAVSHIFERFGAYVIDTDAVYHKLTSSTSDCLIALREEFGDGIIKNGALDRVALGSIVFYGEGAEMRLSRLNAISHKFVLDEARRLISENSDKGYRCAIVDAPLLFESGFDKECDAVVAVVADPEIRIERIMTRDGITRERAETRISKQHTDAWLIEHADYVITNNSDIDLLTEQIENIIDKI